MNIESKPIWKRTLPVIIKIYKCLVSVPCAQHASVLGFNSPQAYPVHQHWWLKWAPHVFFPFLKAVKKRWCKHEVLGESPQEKVNKVLYWTQELSAV